MMKGFSVLGTRDIAGFCLEFSMILGTGISAGDGLALLAEEEKNTKIKRLLLEMSEKTDAGTALSDAMRQSGAFPKYLCDLITVAESTGRLEATLRSLSVYYEKRYRISKTIRSAVAYPLLLGALMLGVVFILVAEVVPIFNDVSRQIGVKPSAAAEAMAKAGAFISDHAVLITAVISLVLAAGILTAKQLPRRGRFGFETAAVRFSAAMEMIIKSGIDIEHSFDMIRTLNDNRRMGESIDRCARYIAHGDSFPEAAEKAGIYSPVFSRMLNIGLKTGSLDLMMTEVARRGEEKLNDKIERAVGLVEPAMIIIISLMAGFIMLSVMLPLLDILTSMGF